MRGRILILELAETPWQWRPFIFRGLWDSRPTWRIGWLGVSLSCYRAGGLHTFFEHVDRTEWKDRVAQ